LLPGHLRHRVAAVHAAVVPMPARGPAVDPDALISLAAACRDNLRARFDYLSGGQAKTSLRNVEPHRLVHTGRLWYLIAFDLTGRTGGRSGSTGCAYGRRPARDSP